MYNDDGSVFSSTSVEGIAGHGGMNGSLRGYGYKVNFKMATGAITEDNTIFEWYAGGKVLGLVGKGFKFVSSPFVYRTAGQYTFKLGILHKASGYMVRLERHSFVVGLEKIYATHINFDFAKNYHLILNPAKWGKIGL